MSLSIFIFELQTVSSWSCKCIASSIHSNMYSHVCWLLLYWYVYTIQLTMLVTSTTSVDPHLSYVDITPPPNCLAPPQSSVMCGTSTCETSGNNSVPVGVGVPPLDTPAPVYHHVWVCTIGCCGERWGEGRVRRRERMWGQERNVVRGRGSRERRERGEQQKRLHLQFIASWVLWSHMLRTW